MNTRKRSRRSVCRRNDVARLILAYLQRHPNAEDTIEGIIRCWLLEQRIHDSMEEVHSALTLLARQEKVVERRQMDGRVVYRFNRC